MDKKDQSKSRHNASEQEKGPKKKPYKKPELHSHGSLSELTKFGGSDRAADFFARRF